MNTSNRSETSRWPTSPRCLLGSVARREATIAVRPSHPLDTPFDIDLVEAERDRERAWEIGADVLPELPNRRQVRQRRRVAEKVVQGDEGVGLAAAIR